MARSTPPQPDELELSVFGRGIGESIVLHVGDDRWIVVDSCLADDSETPAALEYFEDIGIKVSTNVVLVAASHWHDDHIRGLAGLLREASHAKFACSMALRSPEFFTLVKGREQLSFVETTTGIDEFYDILEILQDRSSSRYAVGPSQWGAAGSCVYRQEEPLRVCLTCVSPSSQSVTDGMGSIANRLMKPGGSMGKRFPNASPNEQSMAILVESQCEHALLGADLEVGRDYLRGWRAVVNSKHILPSSRSGLYKVPHHGSPNAHHDAVWDELLKDSPLAVVTAFKSGRRARPAKEDVVRLRVRSSRVYCTSSLEDKKPPRRRGIDGMIESSVRSRRLSSGRLGQVRVRCRSGEAPVVELFGDARRL